MFNFRRLINKYDITHQNLRNSHQKCWKFELHSTILWYREYSQITINAACNLQKDKTFKELSSRHGYLIFTEGWPWKHEAIKFLHNHLKSRIGHDRQYN